VARCCQHATWLDLLHLIVFWLHVCWFVGQTFHSDSNIDPLRTDSDELPASIEDKHLRAVMSGE